MVLSAVVLKCFGMNLSFAHVINLSLFGILCVVAG